MASPCDGNIRQHWGTSMVSSNTTRLEVMLDLLTLSIWGVLGGALESQRWAIEILYYYVNYFLCRKCPRYVQTGSARKRRLHRLLGLEEVNLMSMNCSGCNDALWVILRLSFVLQLRKKRPPHRFY